MGAAESEHSDCRDVFLVLRHRVLPVRQTVLIGAESSIDCLGTEPGGEAGYRRGISAVESLGRRDMDAGTDC